MAESTALLSAQFSLTVLHKALDGRSGPAIVASLRSLDYAVSLLQQVSSLGDQQSAEALDDLAKLIPSIRAHLNG